jgi:4-hydroxythreonine-4-phosphate dehydrogenase
MVRRSTRPATARRDTPATDDVARIAITVGDPGGIGPEVAVKALALGPLPGRAIPVLVGGLGPCRLSGWTPPPAWGRSADDLLPREAASVPSCEGWALEMDDAPDAPRRHAVDPANGRSALRYINCALRLVQDGVVDALVTGPVSKEAIDASGTPFTGHTEYLAAAAHVRHPVMLCVAGALRVAFVTSHIALRKVPGTVTTDRIVETAIITAAGLRDGFGLPAPRIAVCALNPHAGEGGKFGREDRDVVAPAVARLRKQGLACDGPVPGDAVFRDAVSGRWDAVVALYHDQGMIPIKTAWESGPVNMTLGLPFIRTSPAHGTAFDRAGRGEADPRPTRRAIEIAAAAARRRRGLAHPSLF